MMQEAYCRLRLLGSERGSQGEVANASNECGDVGIDVQGRCSTSEEGLAGLGSSAGGLNDGGAVYLGADACWVGGRVGGRDGGGPIGDAGRGSARHGDGVDAVDGRGEIDGGIVDLSVGGLGLGECECDKRKEDCDDLLEGAHFGGGMW